METPTSVLSALPHKHRRFVEEYVVDFNGCQAAIRAKYSRKTARFQASQLLTNHNIQRAVKELTAKASAKAELTVERVVQEIAVIAFQDPTSCYDEHGELIPIAQLPPHVARTIAGIEIHTEHIAGDGTKKPIVVLTKKYKFWDKNAALQMGGRYLKMFTDKHEFSASSLEELVLLATTLDQEKAKA